MPSSAVTIDRIEYDLGPEQIKYIPNDDFDSATEQDFAEIDFALYAEDDVARQPADPSAAAESFLLAVQHSRLLTAEGEQFLFKRLNFLRFRASALQATLKGRKRPKKTVLEVERLLREADETREQIACANLRLVASIVRKLSNSPDEFDEFLAEGNSILLNAVDKFDYGRGYRFSTYATHAVQRHTYRLIERSRKRRQKELHVADELGQLAGPVGQSESEGKQVLAAVEAITASFDSVLNEREQEIVRSRFGLDGSGKSKSMRAIGDDIGLSKERVRQILHKSLDKLAQYNKSFESLFEDMPEHSL